MYSFYQQLGLNIIIFLKEEARLLATNMLNAVKYLHDHDIVHRDLKPEVKYILYILYLGNINS